MDLVDRPRSEREEYRAQASRDELAERITRVAREEGTVETLEGLRLRRASSPTELGHGVSFPALCVVAQGSKEVLLGDDLYRYDPAHYLVTTAVLPITTRVTEASEERPYLGLVLRLDPALVGSVMVEAGHPAPWDRAAVRAFDVSPLAAGLLDAVLRLVRLLDSPAEEARFLRPLASPGRSSFGSSKGSRGAGFITSRPWAATATALSGPWSGSAITSTSRCGLRTSPESSG